MIKNVSTSEMVLDINHLQFTDEIDVFGLNVEILNRITALNKLNRFCKSIRSPFRANTEILFKVIDSIIKENEFTKEDLQGYFKERLEIEKFESNTYRILDFSKFEMPVLAELIIIGLSHEKYINMNETEKEALYEAYFESLSRYDTEKVTIDEFLSEVQELIGGYKKEYKKR